MEFLLPLLGGALGAAVINGVLALYKLKKDKSDEHWQWLRNQRLDAYATFLEATDKVQRSFIDYKNERKTSEDVHVLIEAFSVQRLLLLGSSETAEAHELLAEAMIGFGEIFDPIPADLAKLPAAVEAYSLAITALRAAMTEDLQLDRPIKGRPRNGR
jgi:hypothetical protein